MSEPTLKLQSLNISRSYYGDKGYTAKIAFSSVHGDQTLNLTAEQAVRILDAALEAMADAARQQADLIREQVTAELEGVIAKERAKALAAPVVEDLEAF